MSKTKENEASPRLHMTKMLRSRVHNVKIIQVLWRRLYQYHWSLTLRERKKKMKALSGVSHQLLVVKNVLMI